MEITKITKKEAHNIISVFKPLGLFYLESNGRFVAIDNSSGEAFIEEFNNEEKCLQWLKDRIKKPDSESYDDLRETMDDRRETFNNIWDILKKQRAIDDKRKAEGVISNSEALESSKELLKYFESKLEYTKQYKQRIQIQYNIYDTMLNGTIKEIDRISTLINNLKENIKLSEESWKAHKGE